MRDANRGGCSQSCRWKYDLYDMPFGKERKSLQGEIPEKKDSSIFIRKMEPASQFVLNVVV
ncbi:TPA: hypothetical protein V0913_001445 [Streptococcus pneumoniae]|nr:hypothetical protein [Streptococcus pneumoniae]